MSGHRPSGSISTTQNQKAQLANAYSELGKELASSKVRVVGNYTLGKVIGEGAYGKVRIGTHRLTATRVAIKQIPKAMSASLTREIHHHRQLHHPHIAQMYEVIATENSIWIVTELCSGGELFDFLVEKGRLDETEAKFIFGQLCLAVAYLHNKGIVHRDLKLENVLLDERCRVKLGDFGFTREFEKNTFMETFCGTTGYASPEMLQCKKYTGPEVDIWSLGVILYCLLTGMLPFDDDDESVMRDKIIQGDFEDPTWLSTESRDLIKNLLQKDSTQRLTLPQILAHPWFTTNDLHYEMVDESSDRPFSPGIQGNPASSETSHSTSATSTSTTDSNYTSAPTTPDDSTDDPFTVGLNDNGTKDQAFIHRNLSETTIRTKLSSYQSENLEGGPSSKIGTVPEEDGDDVFPDATTGTFAGQVSANNSNEPTPNPRRLSGSSVRSHAPPMHSVRTPARTKRRSISSTLSLTLSVSNPSSPTMEKTPTMERTPTLPDPSTTQESDVDFVGLLSTPAPIIFSTPLERQLLNSLSLMGFDLGQICYSVMNDACDATGALWWMLMKKAESKERERKDSGASEPDPVSAISPTIDVALPKSQPNPKTKKSRGIQTDIHAKNHRNKPLPQLGIVPPTPTTITGTRPATPPSNQRSISPTPKHTPSSSTNLLEPNPRSSSLLESPMRSNPSTPGSKGRKARSGSVSIMQRATTALEAAGLVRKKSAEGVREQRDREVQAHYERERSKEIERKSGISLVSNEESRTSTSSKLTKSPPLKPTKAGPSTPPPSELHQSQPANVGSPWVLTESRDSLLGKVAPTPTNSPGEPIPPSISSLNLGEESASTGKSRTASRNRANLLTAFRLWFNEDRKGKRKENASSSSQGGSRFSNYSPASPPRQYSTTNVKRRSSGGNGNTKRRSHRATHRASISSKRSSSVNSRRSSVASIQMVVLDSPMAMQQQPRRSMGSYTPNSDRAEYIDYGSRPSSVTSFSMPTSGSRNHKKSPSASSTGSMSMQQRAASPSLKNYHRRGSSGGSTRVVRQQSAGAARPMHVRSNSAASSIPSPSSSRPTSYIEYSENEGQRTASPQVRSRKHSDATPTRKGGGSTFIQKRQGPFSSPIHSYGNSLGRSSWKKSWGLEPPGWRTRTTHLPVEVLAISPVNEPSSLRDVFSGRQSLGDESDWVDDEDDDIPYAPGLGQLSLNAAASGSASSTTFVETTVTLSPAPRGHRTSKRSGSAVNTSTSTRQKAPTAGRVSPVQEKSTYEPGSETRTSRRQLPASARSGPGLAAMQEEDEEEEE